MPVHGSTVVSTHSRSSWYQPHRESSVYPPPPGTQVSVRLRGSYVWEAPGRQSGSASARVTDTVWLFSYLLMAVGLASGLMTGNFSNTWSTLRHDDRRGWTLSQVQQRQQIPAGKLINPGELPDLDVPKDPRDKDKTYGRPSTMAPGDDDDWDWEREDGHWPEDRPPYDTRKETYELFGYVEAELSNVTCRFIREMITCGPHTTRTYDMARAKRKELIHEGVEFPHTIFYEDTKCSKGVGIAHLSGEVSFDGSRSTTLYASGKFYGARPKQNCLDNAEDEALVIFILRYELARLGHPSIEFYPSEQQTTHTEVPAKDVARVAGVSDDLLTKVERTYPDDWTKAEDDNRYSYRIQYVYRYGSGQPVSTTSVVDNQHIDPPPWVSSNVVNDYTARCIGLTVYQVHYVQPCTWRDNIGTAVPMSTEDMLYVYRLIHPTLTCVEALHMYFNTIASAEQLRRTLVPGPGRDIELYTLPETGLTQAGAPYIHRASETPHNYSRA